MAGFGEPLTLVCTDVEGSTELWEWDNSSMMLVPPLCPAQTSTLGERER